MTRLALDAVRAVVTVAAGIAIGLALTAAADLVAARRRVGELWAEHPDALYAAALEAQALTRERRDRSHLRST